MSDLGFGSPQVAVGFDADDASLARLSNVIESAITKGFKDGFDNFAQLLARTAGINRSLQQVQREVTKTGQAFNFEKGNRSLKATSVELIDLVAATTKLGHALSLIEKQVVAAGKLQEKAAIDARAAREIQGNAALASSKSNLASERVAQIAANNERLLGLKRAATEALQIQRAELDQVGRVQRQESQQAVIETRISGQQRVAIVRGVIRQIEVAERGLGAVVSGVASVATGVTRTVGRALSGIGSLFHRANSDFTDGVNTSLRRRETEMRQSFERQTLTVRREIGRQSAQLEKFRLLSSRGITGAVTGRGVGGGIGLALAGLGGGIGFGALLAQGFRDSVNLTEQLNKNKVVFGQFADEIVKFSKTSVNSLGTTQAAALTATGTFGNLFRAIGLGEGQSTIMSERLVTLATDLASFNNTPVEQAFEAIRSGLVGEQEPLRKFGVNLNETTLKAKAMELGLFNGKGVLDANAKAQAAYALILEQTTLAQGDWARTADVGANAQRRAKAAAEQFFSTLAGGLKGIVTLIANALVPIFNTLTALVSGEGLSTGLQLVRDGLKGIGIALGVLLAAKAGIEVLQLLGTFVGFAVTPMGLLVTAVLGLGAALGILLPRSEGLRDTISNIIDKAKSFGTTVLNFVQPILASLGKFITETLIPKLGELASWVGEHLVTAFHAVADFTRNTVIPALQQFWGFLSRNFLPVVRTIGTAIGTAFDFAKDKIADFWHFVQPYIQPAIDGFVTLGGAIAAVATGDFSKLGQGALSALSGIGGSLKNIGVGIFDALKPIGEKVLGFLKGLFTIKNLTKVLDGFLWLVEKIGYIIGRIVSDPRVLAVVAGLAVLAVKTGIAFAKGLAEGISENLPTLLGIIGDGLLAGLKALLDPKVIATIIIGAFAYTSIIRPIIGLFSRAGAEAGQSFGAGLKTKATAAGGFLQGLFLGPSGIQASQFFKGADEADRKMQAVNNQLRIFGSSKLQPDFKTAQAEVENLKKGLTDAQIAGLQMRDKITQGIRAIGSTVSGAGNVVAGIAKLPLSIVSGVVNGLKQGFNAVGKGLQNAFADFFGQARLAGDETGGSFFSTFKAQFKGGLSQMKAGFAQAMNGLREYAATQGSSAGAVLGKGIAKGAVAALAGFEIGKATGRSGQSALLGVAGGAVTGAAFGGVPGAIVGAIAGGIGSALGEGEKAASEMKASVQSLASAIQSDLKNAVDGTLPSIISFKEALAAGGTEGGLGQALLGELDSSTIAKLHEAGVSLGGLTRALADAESGDNSALKNIISLLGKSKEGIDLAKAIQAVSEAIDEVNNKRQFTGDAGLFGGVATFAAINAGIAGLNAPLGVTSLIASNISTDFGRAALSAQDIGKNLGTPPAIEQTRSVVIDLNRQLDTFIAKSKEAFPGTGNKAQNQAIVSVSQTAVSIATIDVSTVAGSAELRGALQELHDQVAEFIATGLTDGSIQGAETLNTQLQPLLLGAIQKINLDDSLTQTQKDAAIKSVTDLFVSMATDPATLAAAMEAGVRIATNVVDPINGIGGRVYPLGVNVAYSLAKGITDNIKYVADVASALANSIPHSIKGQLIISSPSKVMYEIGQQTVQGLIDGVSDASKTLADVVSGAVDDAVARASDAATAGASALRKIATSIFGATTGSDATFGGGLTANSNATAVGGVTTALASFLSNFESVVSSAFEVGKIKPKDRSLSQQIIAASSVFSLDPTNPVGVSNLGALTGALDAIAGLGQTLISQGTPAEQVTGIIHDYVGQLEGLASQLGFSADQVNALVEAFGLSDSALQDFLSTLATVGANLPGTTGTGSGHGTVADKIIAAGGFTSPQDFLDKLAPYLEENDLAILRNYVAAGASVNDLIAYLRTFGFGGGSSTGDTGQGAPPSPDTNTDSTLDQLPRPIIVHVYPPNGDPAAVGLATANALAMAASIG